MARVLAIGDLCAKGNVEFRKKTLPDGLAKLIAWPMPCRKSGRCARGR